ncbi:MAG TPA: hypothetical protein DEA90_05230 [Opitutae bacterium]|nr:hypothetical protein [Puniceicoccaceae bacterium]HBR93549.1 hypothetical protein [Opitutae bacterium]|tara:strand:- start:452 stop:2020 length:1569 start_codon:yes stop_codon:yes gene_type:complete
MKRLIKFELLSAALLWFLASTISAQMLTIHETEVVEINGSFSDDSDGDGWPDGWPMVDGASMVEEENGNSFLRLSYRKPDELIALKRNVPIPSNHHAYFFSCRARFENIQKGKEQWHDGRIIFNFLDANGKRISSPNPPYFKRTSKGWITKNTEFLVPEAAQSLEIILALFQVKSGTLEFDDLLLVPIPAEPLIERIRIRKAERLADQERRAALVKPQIEAPAIEDMPGALKVFENKLLNPEGEIVTLRGLSVPSLEWVSNGEHIFESIRTAVEKWDANVIRLPVSDIFWIGKGPYQKDGGAAYRQLVEDAANLCASLDVYMILDLHHNGIPVELHYNFWAEAAERLKENPAVIFEVFNTATYSEWDQWQSDMQRMLEVIRATGAQNLIIVDAMNGKQLLDTILKDNALKDPKGNGIVYSFHLYPDNDEEMESMSRIATKKPIFITELGAWSSENKEATAKNQEWANKAFSWLEQNQMHWAAWCFHPLASPSMLSGWDYHPSQHWGIYVKDALKTSNEELEE